MKTLVTFVAIAVSAISLTAYADSTLTVEGVHNCCKKCEKGITAAVTSVPGATAAITKETVVITAASDADTKKAAEALAAAGYYGKGIDAPAASASGEAATATVSNIHLCCKKCADAEKGIYLRISVRAGGAREVVAVGANEKCEPRLCETSMAQRGQREMRNEK